MTDSARRGGQQARARVRPLDRWPQHCAPMTGVAAKSIAVLMCRGCRSNCSARAAPAARGCPSGDGRGLPDIGYHREHGVPVGPSRYTAPGWCGSVAADDGGGPGCGTRSRPASRPTRRPAQPTARRRGQSAPRSGSALPRPRPSPACSMTPRGRPAAGAPVCQPHDVGTR
jgi:hypothetical protein